MTKEKKERYDQPEELREILLRVLEGWQFVLECGHHAYVLEGQGNNITVYNGREFRITCRLCSH